jgi:hypothetical protein
MNRIKTDISFSFNQALQDKRDGRKDCGTTKDEVTDTRSRRNIQRDSRVARCLVGVLRLLTGDAPARTREAATPGPCLPATKTRPTPAVAFLLARLLSFSPLWNCTLDLINNRHITVHKWKQTQIRSRMTIVGLLKSFRPVCSEGQLLSHQDLKLILLQVRHKTSQTDHHHRPQKTPW